MGASCNFMIAAARLGLQVGAVGHVGDDVYGDFMRRIMQVINITLNVCFKLKHMERWHPYS